MALSVLLIFPRIFTEGTLIPQILQRMVATGKKHGEEKRLANSRDECQVIFMISGHNVILKAIN